MVYLEFGSADDCDVLAYCLCHGILSFVKRLRVAPLRPLPFHRLGFGSGFLTFLGASLALARLSINQFHPRVDLRMALAALLQGNFFPLAQHSSVLAPCSVLIASHFRCSFVLLGILIYNIFTCLCQAFFATNQ